MGTNTALRFCFRLLFLVTLSHGAAIRPNVAEQGLEAVARDLICPCISRSECPRPFGSQPEDALLGSFSPCTDPESVRCCGVTTTVSVEHSTSHYPAKSKPASVVSSDVVVPVPIAFPETVDPRTTTISPGNEGEDVEYYDDYIDYENEGDEAKQYAETEKAAEDQGKTLKGENIDEDVSQADAFVSPDRLDYSGVNKLLVTGGVQTTNAAVNVGNRGEISSSKRVESTSSSSSSSSSTSSSSSKKTESIASSGSSSSLGQAQGLTLSALPGEKVPEELNLVEDGKSTVVQDRFNSLKSGLRGKTMFENHQETSSQQNSEKVTKESSNSEQTSSSSLRAANQEEAEEEEEEDEEEGEEDVLLEGGTPGIAIVRAEGMAINSGDDASYQSHTRVSNEQKSESVVKESKNVEENNYSNVESVALTGNLNEASGIALGRTAGIVHDERKELSTSQQQSSSSMKQESSTFEENTSSNVQSVTSGTAALLDDNSNSKLLVTSVPQVVAIGSSIANRGNVVYGQRLQELETSSQQQSNSVKKESSKFEESTSSKSQSVSSNVGSQLDVNEGSSIAVATRQPALSEFRRRPTAYRGDVVYNGEQKETSSQQQSSSMKQESSKFEENTSSNAKSVTFNTAALLNDNSNSELLVTSNPRVAAIGSSISNRGNVVYGQRSHQLETSSQQQSNSLKKESSKFEESTSSKSQSVSSNVGSQLDVNEGSSIAVATRQPALSEFRRRPTAYRGDVVYNGEQKETSSQQQSSSMKQESSKFEENTSSNAKSVTFNTAALLNDNSNSELLVTSNPRVAAIGSSISNRGNVVYGQRSHQLETSSQQQSNSLKKESSKFEESTSSKSQSVSTNIGSQLDVNEGSSIAVATRQPTPQEIRRRPTAYRGNVVYGSEQQETSSQQQSTSVKKESSNFEESTSSKTQSVSTDVGNQLNVNEGSSIAVAPAIGSNAFYGQKIQQLGTSSQQQSNSLKKESSNFEESTSSKSQSVSTDIGSQLDVNEGSSIAVQATRQPALTGVRRRPTAYRGNVVYGEQKETSSQQQSTSVKKESSNFEESTSSKAQSVSTNVGNELNVNEGSSIAVASAIGSDAAYGQKIQQLDTSSQQQSNSLKKESSNFEESTSSKVQTSSSNTVGNQLSENEGLHVIVGTRRPVSVVRRRPTANRNRLAHGRRKVTNSSQQQSNSVKKESSSFEENTSSNVQSSAIKTENLLDARRPVPAVRRPITNRGSVTYNGLQTETSSQQQSSSVKKESSNFEENTSSNVQTTAASTAGLSNEDSSSGLVVTTGGSVQANRGHVVYGQKEQTTSSQQQSTSLKKESSSSEENTSSNVKSIVTNAGGLTRNDANSELLDTSSIGKIVSEERKESSSHEESKSVKKESSSFEESTSSNVQTSNAAELSRDESAYGQHKETTSTKESSQTEKKESSSLEENTSSNNAQVVITDQTRSNVESRANIDHADRIQSSIINQKTASGSTSDGVYGGRIETSSIKNNEMTSSKSSSTKKESSSTSTSTNLSTSVTGQKSVGSTVVSNMHADANRGKNTQVWQVDNHSYIPVLINAGFLRDRPIATGAVGLDPLSGVTHTDLRDAQLAAELLPLSCGNVVFGERFKDGRTLVCDIPDGNGETIRFLGGNNRPAVNREKLDGPILLDAILPDEGKAHIASDSAMHRGSSSTNENVMKSTTESRRTETSMTTNSRASESHSEDISKITTAEGVDIARPRPLRRRVIARRPVQVPVVEDHRQEETVPVPRPRPNVSRGRIHFSKPEAAIEVDQSAIGSRQFSQDSSSTSSSSSTKASSVQESNSQQGITKSEFDISSTDQYDAARETGKKNSRLFLLPVAPILPRPDNPHFEEREANAGGPELSRIVEVVDEAPVTRTRVSKKRMRNLSSGRKQPPKELEVLNIRRSEDDGANTEEAQFVIPAESLKKGDFLYRRESREAKEFAPKVKGATISSEELSMPGRVSVIGPIPAGYKDPALDKKEDLGADQLPANDRLPAVSESAHDFGKKIATRDTRRFQASPVDPIAWP